MIPAEEHFPTAFDYLLLQSPDYRPVQSDFNFAGAGVTPDEVQRFSKKTDGGHFDSVTSIAFHGLQGFFDRFKVGRSIDAQCIFSD